MKKLIFAVAVTFGLFSAFSCKTKDTDKDCSKCKASPPDKIANIRIADIDKTFKVWIRKDTISNSYAVASENRTSDRAEMSAILAFYKIDAGNIIKDKDLVSVVLYATGAIDAERLEESDVLGVTVYISTPEQMFVHVFKNTGGEMKSIDALSSETWALNYNDIYSLSSVFGFQQNIVAWQIGAFKLQVIKKKAKRNLEHNLNKYLNISYLSIGNNTKNILGLGQSLHSAKICLDPCHLRGRGICVVPEGADPFCYPEDDEPTCAVLTMQPGNNYDWDNDPRHPFLYDFRDNVLGSSATGAHIQDDFYYCGSIISGKITAAQAADGFSLIDNYILSIVTRLNSGAAASDSSVIFDKSVRDNINTFVAEIKTISTDATFQEILDEVTANVNYCEGKTVAQIKYELTH